MQKIRELFRNYKKNMDRQHELDEMLLIEQSKQDWILGLKERTEEMQIMYEENEQILQKIEDILSKPLLPEYAEILYEETYDMYWNDYDDCQVLLRLLEVLIPYYELMQETEKLLFLYGAIYYEENEIQNRRGGTSSISMEYNKKILNYKPVYNKLKTVEIRSRIFKAYYNIIVVGLGNGAIDIKTSYHWYRDMINFWNSKPVQALDGRTKEISSLVEQISYEWMTAEEYIEQADKESKEEFCRLAVYYYEKEKKEVSDTYSINSEVYAAWLHAQTLKGKQNFSTILDLYLEYYLERLKHCSELEMDKLSYEDFYFIINTPLTLERWLHYGISEEKSQNVMMILKKKTEETWHRLKGYSPPFLNEIMVDWCFKVMKYLHNQSEKEEWLFGLLVRRQLPTYLHSVMVMYLAVALCEETIQKRPDLFCHIPEMSPEELVEFVRKCALLHDVGKIRITDIINTQGRKLWEKEFLAIKMHPEYGAQLLAADSDFAKYRDIVLGHHKYYNGKGGYPVDFDNTASKYRIIVDLITICDCMDAATDTIGRNYKKNKSIEEVLVEMEREKGSRYNPDLIEIIVDSKKLIKKMGYIIGEGRMDIMYHAYSEFIGIV